MNALATFRAGVPDPMATGVDMLRSLRSDRERLWMLSAEASLKGQDTAAYGDEAAQIDAAEDRLVKALTELIEQRSGLSLDQLREVLS